MSITYKFDELPLRAHGGKAVAHVTGTAEITPQAPAAPAIEITLDGEDGPVSLHHFDPLYLLLWCELVARYEAGEIDEPRPYRDENAEHRLSVSQVL